MAQTNFSAKVTDCFSNAVTRAHDISHRTFSTFSNYFKMASGEARALYDGAMHAAEVSPDEGLKIRRDALGLCTETGVSITEAVEFEAAFAIAAAQAGEKSTHHGNKPMLTSDWQQIAAETLESLIVSPVAAMHCAHDLFHDLGHAGRAYEAARRPLH